MQDERQEPAARSKAGPRLPWFRRAGRRGLTGLRPLAAPFLHRFQLRLGTAIEQSAVAATGRDTGVRLDRVETRLGALETTLSQLQTSIQEALGALLDRQGASEQQQGAMLTQLTQLLGTAVSVRLERLQLGIDAVRLDQKAAASSTLDAVGRLELDQKAAASSTLDAVGRLDLARRETDEIIRDGYARTATMTGLVRAHSDLLLQRVAIPLGDDVLLRTPEGFLLAPAEDATLVAAMHESGGRLEPGTVAVLTALLLEGDWAVDVGAHIGTTVLPAARRVGPTGRIIAVEPASRVRDLLRRGLVLNGVEDRVVLHACAAGSAPGTAQLNLGQVSGHSSVLPLLESERTEEVPVVPLDNLVESGRRVRLAKLDAEGFELEVWRGMRRIVAENESLAVVVEFGPTHLHRAGVSVADWLGELLAPGFTAYEVDEADGSLRPLRARSELVSVFSINLLLLRQPPSAFPALRFA